MKLNDLINKLDIQQIKKVCNYDETVNILFYNSLEGKQDKLDKNCLYVSDSFDLSNCDFVDSNIIVIDHAKFDKKLFDNIKCNIYLAPSSYSAEQLLEQIAKVITDDYELTQSTKKLLDILYKGSGLQSLVDCATDIFGNPIFINDTAYKILAMSYKTVYIDETLEKQKETGYIIEKNLNLANQEDQLKKIRQSDKVISSIHPITNESWLFKSVKIHGIAVADIAVIANNHPFRSIDYTILEEFSKIIAIELEKNSFYKENRGTMYNFFLGDLLSNKIHNMDTFIQRARTLDLKLYKWIQILLVTDKKNVFSIEKKQYVCNQLRTIIPDCRWTVYNNNLIVFISRPNKHIFTQNEKEKIRAFLKDNELSMGISHSFTAPLKTSYYYQQAITASSIGIQVYPNQELYYYEDTMIYSVAKSLLNIYSLEDICPENLHQLHDYDKEKGTNLIETLYEYLKYVSDPVTAANELHIHYNTLLYRINKIKDITGIDLSKGEERLKIQLYLTCYYYFDLIK